LHRYLFTALRNLSIIVQRIHCTGRRCGSKFWNWHQKKIYICTIFKVSINNSYDHICYRHSHSDMVKSVVFIKWHELHLWILKTESRLQTRCVICKTSNLQRQSNIPIMYSKHLIVHLSPSVDWRNLCYIDFSIEKLYPSFIFFNRYLWLKNDANRTIAMINWKNKYLHSFKIIITSQLLYKKAK